MNSAHGAHDAHDHPQVTPTGEVVPEPSEPVDNPPSDPDRFPDEELL